MAEKDYGLMVAALVAVVAIVGLVMGPSTTGMLPANYGAAYRPTNPFLQRGTCPDGYSATSIVCDFESLKENRVAQDHCYRTGELYCVKSDLAFGGSTGASREYGAERALIANAADCFAAPADEAGVSYYLCG